MARKIRYEDSFRHLFGLDVLLNDHARAYVMNRYNINAFDFKLITALSMSMKGNTCGRMKNALKLFVVTPNTNTITQSQKKLLISGVFERPVKGQYYLTGRGRRILAEYSGRMNKLLDHYYATKEIGLPMDK